MAAEADKISAKLQSYSVASHNELWTTSYCTCDVVAHAWLSSLQLLHVVRWVHAWQVFLLCLCMPMLLIPNTIVPHRGIAPKVLFILQALFTTCYVPMHDGACCVLLAPPSHLHHNIMYTLPHPPSYSMVQFNPPRHLPILPPPHTRTLHILPLTFLSGRVGEYHHCVLGEYKLS